MARRGGSRSGLIAGQGSAGQKFPRATGRQQASIAGARPSHIVSGESVAAAGGSYPVEVAADSPVHWWRMGEASGSVIDSGSGANNGTTTGTVTRNVSGLINATDDDGAIQFAASAYVSGSLGVALPNVFSIEMWVRLPASGTATITPFSTKSATQSNVSMSVLRSGSAGSNFCVAGYIYDGSVYDRVAQSNDSVVAAGGTYHIVWTRAGTPAASNKVYINGVESVNPSGVAQAVVITDTTWWIGGWEGASETWPDKIDEVAVYNTVLSPERVLAHYNAGITGGGAGAQAIDVPLLNQAAVVAAPTITTGVVNISVGLLNQTATTSAPTITTGVVNVSVGLITQTAATFTPSVQPGVRVLTVGLINQAAVTSTPTVSQQQFYTPALIDQTAVATAPTIQRGAVNLTLALINQTAVATAPTVQPGAVFYTPALITQTATTFAPSLALGLGVAQWTTPADTVTMAANPILAFILPTGATGLLHFQIQIDEDSGFGSPTIIDSSSSQTGWEYWNGSGWVVVPAGGVNQSFGGNEARHTVQSPLATGTYYRRVRAGVVT